MAKKAEATVEVRIRVSREDWQAVKALAALSGRAVKDLIGDMVAGAAQELRRDGFGGERR